MGAGGCFFHGSPPAIGEEHIRLRSTIVLYAKKASLVINRSIRPFAALRPRTARAAASEHAPGIKYEECGWIVGKTEMSHL